MAHHPRYAEGTLAGRAPQAREGVPDLVGGTWAHRMTGHRRPQKRRLARELFFREFGYSREPHEVELMKRELPKIHRKSPGIPGAEGVKRLGDAMVGARPKERSKLDFEDCEARRGGIAMHTSESYIEVRLATYPRRLLPDLPRGPAGTEVAARKSPVAQT